MNYFHYLERKRQKDETPLVVTLWWGFKGSGETMPKEVRHRREVDDGLGSDDTHTVMVGGVVLPSSISSPRP